MSNPDEMAEIEARAIRGQVASHTRPDGMRICSRCGGKLAGDDFFVSLMGRGLFCIDGEACVDRALALLADPESDFEVRCERCLRNIRSLVFGARGLRGRVFCADSADCDAAVAVLYGD